MKCCSAVSLFANPASNTGDSCSCLVPLLCFAILLLEFIHVVYHHLKSFDRAPLAVTLILWILKFLLQLCGKLRILCGVPQVVAILVEAQNPALSWDSLLEIRSRLNSVLSHRSVNSLERSAATWAPQPCYREQCMWIVMDHCSWKGSCYAPTRDLHETSCFHPLFNCFGLVSGDSLVNNLRLCLESPALKQDPRHTNPCLNCSVLLQDHQLLEDHTASLLCYCFKCLLLTNIAVSYYVIKVIHWKFFVCLYSSY